MSSNALQKTTNFEYARQVCDFLPDASFVAALNIYREALNDPNLDDYVLAQMALHDRFFLLTNVLNFSRVIFNLADKPQWIYERCREVEADPDGYLDLWAREHFKSVIITFAGSIQECAKDSAIYQDLNPPDAYFRGEGQEITICILSQDNAGARKFVKQDKHEIETNPLLHRYWPDVFWKNPKADAPSWSVDAGIYLKRKSNPKEPTISGHGLVDGLPTGPHYKLIITDDAVTKKSVGTPDQIIKTTDSYELSDFLTARIDKTKPARRWGIGTRYNFADTYGVLIKRGALKTRIYPATEDGTPDGKPVLLSQEQWDDKKRTSSSRTIACQMLQNPLAGDEQEFKLEWIRRYEVRPKTLNVGILVDPASSKKKGTSNSAFAVIGLDANFNKYLLDGACHKMNLGERWTMLKNLRSKWLRQPGVQAVLVGYEKYGMQSDIEHFEEMMQIEKTSFPIQEINWTRDDSQAKDDRIRRLIPDHQNWKFFYPYEGGQTANQMEAVQHGEGYLVAKPIKRKNHEGRIYNLVQWMIDNEYSFFPATTVKDFMDSMSRFYDLDINPPQIISESDLLPEYAGDY